MSRDFAGVRLLGIIAAVGGISIWLLITVIAWQVTKRALRPVDEIVRQTARIDTPHLGERLPVGAADDELARVARTVNKMLDRIQDGYRRERQFTGDASHEMRNPLAKMLAEIELALSRPRAPAEYEQTLGRLKSYAEGMQQLAESLLILARLEGGLERLKLERFDMVDLAMELVKTLPRDAAQRVHLKVGDSDEPMQVTGHRRLIGILLNNLLDNALRYGAAPRPVQVRISRNCQTVRVDVEDEGPGIPESQRALAFNRFHRLEPSRSKQTGGIGLGLSIVRAIAEVHGTTVTLDRGTQAGTIASFTLPASPEGASSGQPQQA
jgi:signal transduction histidine kinase